MATKRIITMLKDRKALIRGCWFENKFSLKSEWNIDEKRCLL